MTVTRESIISIFDVIAYLLFKSRAVNIFNRFLDLYVISRRRRRPPIVLKWLLGFCVDLVPS